jgi:hypothetical protein
VWCGSGGTKNVHVEVNAEANIEGSGCCGCFTLLHRSTMEIDGDEEEVVAIGK